MRKPITILHVVFSLEPGGMENGLVNVAKALNPEDFQVRVCCLEREGAFVERLTQPRQVHVLGKQKGFSLRSVCRLARLISQTHAHLIHSHNLGPLIYSGLASVMGLRCPILHGEHSLLSPDECKPRRLRQREWLYRGCRKIHTVSSQVRRQLVELGLPASKVTVIPNGVDADCFVPGCRVAARKQIGNLPEGAFVFGIVGRFGPFKRHSVLIDAFTRLARQWPGAHLFVVGGGGPEEGRVCAQAQTSEAAQRIHLVGFQNKLVPFYQAMDLLVVPSVNEGMSNAILEGMACGVPVLANARLGNDEVITHGRTGFIADLATPEKLHAQLEKVLAQTEQLTKMGRMARESVERQFSIGQMVRNYAALYHEVLNGAPGGRD